MVASGITTYVRELHNAESTAGEIEIDSGRGLRLAQLPDEAVRLIDVSINRMGARDEGKKPWFLVNGHLDDEEKWVNGDPKGALQILCTALRLYYGEKIKVGPIVDIRNTIGRYEIPVIMYEHIREIMPVCRPDEFAVNSCDVPRLRDLFGQLVQGLTAPLLKIPIDRFLKAANDTGASDAMIDQSIALEALYLDHDRSNKGKILASRGAAFADAGNSTDTKQTYVNLRCFYLARNKILHDGEESPTITFTTGLSKNCTELQSWCFGYIRKVIRSVLGNEHYLHMDKTTFVRELQSRSRTLCGMFRCIDDSLLTNS